MSSNNGNSTDEEGAAGDLDSSRLRNDSESSKSSDEGADQTKRQKTAREFIFEGVAASPPKFVSLEEIISASKGITNMALAHEIAVDKDFRLKKSEPAENTLEKVVKETVHKAFWDLLALDLKEDPPSYDRAFVLLAEIKEGLFSLLLPQHSKIREQITEMLDTDLIKQQAEKGVLDFQQYAHWIINLMSKLCAPARDEKIREIMQMTDIVDIFRGILQTLELMMLDWANFHIGMIRPTLVQQSVEYEKKKFTDYLQVCPDGLDSTRKWLLRHYTPSDEAPRNVQTVTSSVVADAYMDLLDWDSSNPYPETLAIDEGRFKDLSERYRRVCVCAAVLLVTSTSVPRLQGVSGFKETLKTHINLLLKEAKNEESIEKVIPNVADQVVKDVNDSLRQLGPGELDESTAKLLHGHVIDVAKPDHNIRQLVRQRVLEFLHKTITSPTAAPVQVPLGLSSLSTELTSLTGQFLRLVSHNRAVFGEFYSNIVAAAVDRPQP